MPDAGEIIPWEPRVVPPKLGDSEVHVWYFSLRIPSGRAAGWNALLSPDEIDRAARFAFPHLRERYVAAHAILRRLLGAYLNVDPPTLRFKIAERGKPSLAGDPVHFNLSHTRDAGLFAVTRVGEIGVDMERLDRKVDRHGIAERFFSKFEAGELAALSEEDQAEGFCNLWTRKEGWLKATGVGISEGLSKIEFNCQPGEPARLLRIDGDPTKAADWLIESLRPTLNHIGAIALRAKEAQVRVFSYAADL